MSRQVVETMKLIFDALKAHVSIDDSCRIASVKRHIKPIGDSEPVCEFVKGAKVKSFSYNGLLLCLYEFCENRYLLLPEKNISAVCSIGFEIEEDIAIIQGAGMLAMALEKWPILDGISSLEVVNCCLGVDIQDIEFEFSMISKLFTPYSVIKLDDSRLELSYEEDVGRLCCYILAEDELKMSEKTKNNLQDLSLLRSSRSIAASILSGFWSPLVEYTFLQLYQCLEYLYRLNNCFIISEEHNITLEAAIDIVTLHEFKISEEDNLYQVIRRYAAETVVDSFVERLSLYGEENNDKNRKVSHYIYKLRCNIAHLRYNQDNVLKYVNWDICVEELTAIIYSIYQKIDTKVCSVCESKGVWTSLK